MAKIAVSEAARRLGIPAEEFLRQLKELGVNVIDGFSELSQEQFTQIRVILSRREKPSTGGEVVEKRVSGSVIRRRRKAKAEAEEAAPQPAEEPEPEPYEEGAAAPEPIDQGEEPYAVGQAAARDGAALESPEYEEIEPSDEIALKHDAEAVGVDLEPQASEERAAKSAAVEQAPPAREEESREPRFRVKTIEQALLEQRRAKVAKEAQALNAKLKAERAKARKMKTKEDKVEPAKIIGKPVHPPVVARPEPAPQEPAQEAKAKKGRRIIELLPDTSGRRPTTSASRKREAYERQRAEKAEKLFARKVKRSRQAQPKPTEAAAPKGIKRAIRIEGEIVVSELAKRMGIKGGELIKRLMGMGMMVTINQAIDPETAAILGDDLGFSVENVEKQEADFLKPEEVSAENLQPRPPVVTIMGHVDHGKTTLLDRIRSTNVAEGEAGGITQHIGAYKVSLGDRGDIVFLDTPGHEAFTAMRARGAQATDIVVLIVAADDGVMPQTKESISHARSAGVPIIVAINKIDKPDAQPDRIRQELTEFNLLSEEWGGDTLFAQVSAKQGIGVEDLLEKILLQAEIMELSADPDKPAKGVVIESKLERGRGPIATMLVQEGTLRIGDAMVVGTVMGRVRSMMDDKGRRLDEAGPSTPVEVMGLSGVPNAGDAFYSVRDERAAKQVVEMRQDKMRQADGTQLARMRLEDFYDKMQEGETKELRIILKADVHGSIEAIQEALTKLSTEQTKVQIIHSAVGAINETDVNLAVAAGAIIVAFNIRPEPKAKVLAEREKVDIKLYTIIYEMIEDIEKALHGMLEPVYEEVFIGRAEVRETFHISRIGTIAGCSVVDGKVVRNAQVRLVRDGAVVWEGKLSSLRRFKDDAREVASGFECGIGLENFNDVKVGDHIECFTLEQKKEA